MPDKVPSSDSGEDKHSSLKRASVDYDEKSNSEVEDVRGSFLSVRLVPEHPDVRLLQDHDRASEENDMSHHEVDNLEEVDFSTSSQSAPCIHTSCVHLQPSSLLVARKFCAVLAFGDMSVT